VGEVRGFLVHFVATSATDVDGVSVAIYALCDYFYRSYRYRYYYRSATTAVSASDVDGVSVAMYALY
jgi:hypothetical protein